MAKKEPKKVEAVPRAIHKVIVFQGDYALLCGAPFSEKYRSHIGAKQVTCRNCNQISKSYDYSIDINKSE